MDNRTRGREWPQQMAGAGWSLTLLHAALSEGLHDHDEECLEIAQDIRLVLTELAERASQALKEEAELKKSVSRLLSRKDAADVPKESGPGTA